jgi:phosphatidylinositol alpha-1,6-mannosyltransferase
VPHLLVTNDFLPKDGGIQTMLWELWRRLPAEEVTILTTPHADARRFDAEQPFRIERVGDPVLLPTPMLHRRIERLAEEVGADHVVIDPVLPLGALAPHLSRPYTVVMHGSELLGRLPGGDALAGHVLRRARHVVCAGSYPAAETRRLCGGDQRTPPITIVPPGVDTERFRPIDDDERAATRARFGLPADVPLIVGLSRLVRRKGFDVLLDATRRLDGVHVAIGGSGRDGDRLRGMAHERAQLVGRVSDDDLPAFYGCADAFAMLCRDQWGGLEKEGFGIVFVEAAACGTPQLAGRSGGSADAVDDGVTGIVLDDPRDVDAVTAAIERLLDPAVNQRMRAASRPWAEGFAYDELAKRLATAIL